MNPKIVTDSIIDQNADKTNESENRINVYPITILRYAILEKIDSPFLNQDKKFEVNTVIPSAYVVCSSKETLKKYSSKDSEKIISDAFDWADERLNFKDVPDLIQNVIKQLNRINEASPEDVGSDSGETETRTGSKKN